MELELDEPLELLFEELFELPFDELFELPFDELLPATMVRSCKPGDAVTRLPCASIASTSPCNGARPVLVLIPGLTDACAAPTAVRPVKAAAIILNLAFIRFSMMIEQTMNLPRTVVLPVAREGSPSPQGRPPIAAVSMENVKAAVFIPAVLKGVVSCSLGQHGPMPDATIGPRRQEA